MTDHDVLQMIEQAFGGARCRGHRPDHVRACECVEHDALLQVRDLASLRLDDVGNAGWDSMCFVSSEGFHSYFPALAKLAIESSGVSWYTEQILLHLTDQGPANPHLRRFSPPQRRTVLTLLRYLRHVHEPELLSSPAAGRLERALALWADDAA